MVIMLFDVMYVWLKILSKILFWVGYRFPNFCILYIVFQAEKEEQTATVEKAVAKETPDQWAQEAVPQMQQPEVTDWAAETMNVQPALGGQFSMGGTVAPTHSEDWSATEDWSKQVPAATGTTAPPTAQWGGDTVENWN